MKTVKLDQVHPRLFMRGHTLKLCSEDVLRALMDKDIRLVVNVATQNDPSLHAACATVGITYKWEPLSDGQTVHEERVVGLARMVSECMADYPVLVHCRAGANRSGLIAVLATAIYDGTSTLDALLSIRKTRPRVLANEAFVKFVQEVKL